MGLLKYGSKNRVCSKKLWVWNWAQGVVSKKLLHKLSPNDAKSLCFQYCLEAFLLWLSYEMNRFWLSFEGGNIHLPMTVMMWKTSHGKKRVRFSILMASIRSALTRMPTVAKMPRTMTMSKSNLRSCSSCRVVFWFSKGAQNDNDTLAYCNEVEHVKIWKHIVWTL